MRVTTLPIHVNFIKTHKDAKLPTKGSKGASGFDLYSVEDVWLYPLQPKLVNTGLKIALPPGYEGQVRPRSGLALKKGLTVLNTPGTVDQDYRGDLGVILVYVGDPEYPASDPIKLEAGTRIAQLVIQTVTPNIHMHFVDSFDSTERGEGGFGSTGET